IKKALGALVIGCLFAGASAQSADMWWDNAAYNLNNWDTAAGWNTGIPSASDTARIKVDVVVADGITAVASATYVGFGTVAGLYHNGGSLTTGSMQLGHSWGAQGRLDVRGGTVDVNGTLTTAIRSQSIVFIKGGDVEVDAMNLHGDGSGSSAIYIPEGLLTLTTANSLTITEMADHFMDFGTYGTSTGKFIANFDWWDSAVLDQTLATGYYNRMKSADGFGSDGVAWHYDGGNTVFEAIPEPATLGLVALVGGALLALRRLQI
ncbi:MAG: PEP-CTERM sorting domain-containing protein, partial [Methylococcales bacterium]|nr:PEP-CTERM sorting domain-containing protein [Methylococcales bacterium]